VRHTGRGRPTASKRLYAIGGLIVISVFLPPLSSVAFDQSETPSVILEVIQAASRSFGRFSPIVHISTVAVLLLLAAYGKRAGRIFDAHFAAVFTLIAVTNNLVVTKTYGFVVLTGNFVPFLIVAIFWIWETYRPRNIFEFPRLAAWRYWVVPFAILAFWFPVSQEGSPDFNPLLLLTSDYGVTFCPTTPVVLAILTLIYPTVNRELLAVTSLAGLLIGIFNAMSVFIMPGYTFWLLVVHVPLIVISLYGLVLPKVTGPRERGGGV
jgi:hypothetical protein